MTASDPSRGCCRPVASETPEATSNRPGLPAVRYRVGTFTSFRRTMLEAAAAPGPLREWTARAGDDFAVALVEMWAYVADILTFYQERAANEAYLRTATRRESVLRLAALLDYRPAPGSSAVAHLAFTAERGKTVRVPEGLRVQSVPGQDERPQKFQTDESVVADSRLNAVRVTAPPAPINPFAAGRTELHPRPRRSSRSRRRSAPARTWCCFPLQARRVPRKSEWSLSGPSRA
ncbi:MAG: hypothetical protein U0835_17500 [Isosphaeraceae bacterium]